MSELVTSASTGLGTTNFEQPNPEASYALQRQAVAPQNDLFRYLDDHWTIIESFAWSSSAQPGTILFSRPITPRESFPILEYLSYLYNTWCGPINYRIEPVSTAFLGGKLACALLPPNYNPRTTNFTAQQLSVWPYIKEDVKNTEAMDLATGDMNAQKFHYFPTSTEHATDPQYIGGWFVVYVVNTLVTSGGTLGAVTVQMSCNARGLMMAGIVPPKAVTPAHDLQSLSLNADSQLPFGDTYNGIVLMSRTDMPTASVFLDGVVRGDGQPYTGRKLTMKGTARPAFHANGSSGPQETFTYDAVFPRLAMRYYNLFHYNESNYAASVSTNDSGTVLTTIDYTGASTGTTDMMAPLPINSIEVTSFGHPSDQVFTPLGTTPESFIMFRGSWLTINTNIHPFNNFMYWQPQPVKLSPEQCVYGQVIDDITGNRICYFKLYFQGFITTSGIATTTIVDHPVTFDPISIVDPHFPLPPASADQLAVQMAMFPHESLKRELKLREKLILKYGAPICGPPRSSDGWESVDLSARPGTCRSNLPAAQEPRSRAAAKGWLA